MGSWGSGIYHSDEALDFLADLQWILMHNIIFGLYPETYGNDEPAHDIPHILASVDLLAVICKHTQNLPDFSQKTVENWRERYFAQLRKDVAARPEKFPEGYEAYQTKFATKLFDDLLAIFKED